MALTKIKPNAVDETLDYSFDDVRANTINLRSYDPVNHTNNAYTQANTATTNAATADQRAVTSGVYANSAFSATNTATTNAATADQRAVTSGSYANSAYGQANTANTNAATADQKAVSAGSYANSAFSSANTRLSTSGGTLTGNLVISGANLNVSGASTFDGTSTFQQSTEKLQTKTSATGVVTHDYSLGALFYHSSISANFTANITNVPTTNDRAIVISLILEQGATAYIPNDLQIDGSSQTINWANGSVPTGNANKKDLVVFSLLRTSSAWTVLGQLSSFG